jgi:hypothetical protein
MISVFNSPSVRLCVWEAQLSCPCGKDVQPHTRTLLVQRLQQEDEVFPAVSIQQSQERI